MILSITRQAEIFVMTILLGIVFCVFYDIIRIVRRIIAHSNILIQIEDGLYWLIISSAMFYFMLYTSYGEIRIFSVIGVFIGMILYFLLISPIVMKLAMSIVSFIEKVVKTIIMIFLFPFKIIINFFKPTFKALGAGVNKKYSFCKGKAKLFKTHISRKQKKILKEFKIIAKKH